MNYNKYELSCSGKIKSCVWLVSVVRFDDNKTLDRSITHSMSASRFQAVGIALNQINTFNYFIWMRKSAYYILTVRPFFFWKRKSVLFHYVIVMFNPRLFTHSSSMGQSFRINRDQVWRFLAPFMTLAITIRRACRENNKNRTWFSSFNLQKNNIRALFNGYKNQS